MGTLSLTARHQSFIRKNRLRMSGSAMAAKFGVSKSVVNRWMCDNKLSVPKALVSKWRALAMTGRSTATKKEDRFIKKHYLTMPVKTIADKLGNGRTFTFVNKRLQQLGLEIPPEIVERNKQIGRIKPGNVPMNKGRKMTEYMSKAQIKKTMATRFRKGQIPHNAIGFKNGDIVTRCDHKHRNGRSYKWIRIALGKWEQLHVHKWKKKYGSVPKGQTVSFKDGNSLNCTLKNLHLVTRQENMKKNSGSLNLTDGFIAQLLARKKGGVGIVDKELAKKFLTNKDLLDLKRTSIILKRKINEKRRAHSTDQVDA